jgi:hypothetical protein
MTKLLLGNESLHSGQKEKSAIFDRAEYNLERAMSTFSGKIEISGTGNSVQMGDGNVMANMTQNQMSDIQSALDQALATLREAQADCRPDQAALLQGSEIVVEEVKNELQQPKPTAQKLQSGLERAIKLTELVSKSLEAPTKALLAAQAVRTLYNAVASWQGWLPLP